MALDKICGQRHREQYVVVYASGNVNYYGYAVYSIRFAPACVIGAKAIK